MWKQEIIIDNPTEIANVIFKLAEAINELPLGAGVERKKIGETIVNLCKLLDIEYKWNADYCICDGCIEQATKDLADHMGITLKEKGECMKNGLT